MTGFPDAPDDGPDGSGGPDPLEPLLRISPDYLAAPPRAFGRIRRRAARRRRARAAAGGTVAVAVVAGALYLVGAIAPDGGDGVVGPPASSSLSSTAPSTPGPSTARPSGPSSPTAAGSHSPGDRQDPVPRTTGGVTPTPSRTTTAATTATGTTPMCAASQLTASLGGGDAGAGNLYRYLVLTNHSSTTCHVTGYPGLSMLDADGAQIGPPAGRQEMAYVAVVLDPGASASDTIHTVNHQGTCLATSTSLRIYPPGSRESLVFPGQVTDCDSLFTITPFAAGKTGNPVS
ncbi:MULTISPECIES: DUF4232 domain-containing protein [unclassified Streptomyces]|uniref:DUF4232 domain-containing protein n=1 Tax=unclassified Streptomyces TaxID=2593676 RepID=UPI002E2AD9BE|nr:DUF4232 domain-containing protein [Streptomyces sp. NBC_00223]